MKPARFEVRRPETLDRALLDLAEAGEEGRVLAGGQSLVPMLNLRLAAPAILVDINRIDELRVIAQEGDRLRVGALVRHAELLDYVSRTDHHPLLRSALPHVAHLAVRNRGTICGSIALADPASELPACALCLGAELHLASDGASRTVAADRFFVGLYETAVQPGEMIVAASFPAAVPGWHYHFEEVARRHGDFALAGIVAALRVEGGRVAEARIVFFGIADRPLRAEVVETALVGERIDDGLPRALDGLAALEVSSSAAVSEAYRRHLMGVLLRRAAGTLKEAASC